MFCFDCPIHGKYAETDFFLRRALGASWFTNLAWPSMNAASESEKPFYSGASGLFWGRRVGGEMRNRCATMQFVCLPWEFVLFKQVYPNGSPLCILESQRICVSMHVHTWILCMIRCVYVHTYFLARNGHPQAKRKWLSARARSYTAYFVPWHNKYISWTTMCKKYPSVTKARIFREYRLGTLALQLYLTLA